MKYKAFLLTILFCIHQQEKASVWQLPDINKRLNEVTFLAAHNAYANYHDGWRYAQQRLTIQEQLAHGVRAFLLDIHKYKHRIVLSHGGTRGIFKLLKSGSYHSLSTTLTLLQHFVEQNPQEVVTIFLENYVNNDRLANEIKSHYDFYKLLLKPADWNPAKNNTQWPTIKWMQEHNKRIIIFNEDKKHSRAINNHDPFFSVWHHVVESQYGTTNIKCACKQRRESKKLNHCKRSLCLLNFFGTISIGKNKKRNSYSRLKKFVNRAQHKMGKKPTWLALDFIDKGNALELVNELNYL